MEWFKGKHIITAILIVLLTIGGIFIYIQHKLIYTLNCEMTYHASNPRFDYTENAILDVNLLSKKVKTNEPALLFLKEVYNKCKVDKYVITCEDEYKYTSFFDIKNGKYVETTPTPMLVTSYLKIDRYTKKITHYYSNREESDLSKLPSLYEGYCTRGKQKF